MTQPDYSGTAVVTFHDAGYGEGMWRASCPVDCSWHGSDHVKREDAEAWLKHDAKGHKCLRRPSIPEVIPPADPQEMRRA